MSTEQASPRHVAYFAKHWPLSITRGGITPYVHHLRDGLSRIGMESSVISPAPEALPRREVVPLTELSRVAGAVVRRMDGWLLQSPLPLPVCVGLAQAVRRARARGVELVEMEEHQGIGRVAVRLGGVPVVGRLHGPHWLNFSVLGAPKAENFARADGEERAFVQEAAGLSCPSRDTLQRMRQHWELSLEQAVVIPNPCAPTPAGFYWRGPNPEAPILFVGRFDRHKGGDLILKAFRKLLGQRPAQRLWFVGEDRGLYEGERRWSLQEYLEQQFPDAQQRAQVEIKGWQTPEDVCALRKEAALVVVPSRYEVFGMVVVEAMGAGCPVIVSDVGAFPELVRHAEDGWVFPSDDAGALARAMQDILEQPELAARLGERAQKTCDARYKPETVATQTRDFYGEILARYRRDGPQTRGVGQGFRPSW